MNCPNCEGEKVKTLRHCSFCNRKIDWPIVIIRGPSIQKHRARICEDCVAICAMQVIAARVKRTKP